MGRPRLYATSVERKAAWRRRHGMAVRPHYPSAAARQAAYRLRKRQAARYWAALGCTAMEQALQTRALADQCWELHALIDDWSRDADMPRRGAVGRPLGLVAGASASFYGIAAARGRRHSRVLQRLAHVRATRAAHVGASSDARRRQRTGVCVSLPTRGSDIPVMLSDKNDFRNSLNINTAHTGFSGESLVG